MKFDTSNNAALSLRLLSEDVRTGRAKVIEVIDRGGILSIHLMRDKNPPRHEPEDHHDIR